MGQQTIMPKPVAFKCLFAQKNAQAKVRT